MRRMTLDNGKTLAYTDTGPGNDGSMLLVHGMGGDHSDMAQLAEHFRDGYRVVSPDLPGHGASHTAAVDCRIGALADAVAALAEHLELTEVVLAGHSLGGLVAAAVAADHPDVVDRLVLLDPGLALPDAAKTDLRAFYDSLEEEGYLAALRQAFESFLFVPSDGAVVVDDVLSRMARLSPSQFREFGYAVLAFDSAEVLGRIVAPTLFVTPQTPLAQLDEVTRLAPSWSFGQVVGTGHYMPMVTPIQVAAMVRQFLAVTAGGSSRRAA